MFSCGRYYKFPVILQNHFCVSPDFVWVTKYRYKVLRDEVAERVRELVRRTCEALEIRIVRGVVSKDHVHILVLQL